jgi:hypothetical protein
MSRCHVRCRKCQARKVLKRVPEQYYRYSVKRGLFVNTAPACGNCGANDFRIDGWMNTRDTKATACSCNGYIHMTRREWPHRIGSAYCWHRKDGTLRVQGDADFKDFQLEQME